MPDIKDIYRPILESLLDGDPHNLAINDLMNITEKYFGLEELSSIDKSRLKRIITHAKNDLKEKKFLANPSNNTYILTAAGRDYLNVHAEIQNENELPAIIPEISEPEMNDVHEEIPQVTESESVQEVYEGIQESEELTDESPDETEEFEEIADVPELDELPDIPDEPEMIAENPQEVQEIQEEPDDIELEDEPESIIEEFKSQEESQEPEQYEMPSDKFSENENITASAESELESEQEAESETENEQIETPSDDVSEDENITASIESESEFETETEQLEIPSNETSEDENITASTEPKLESELESEPENEQCEIPSDDVSEDENITASAEPEAEPEPEIEIENEHIQHKTHSDENIASSAESELESELESETEPAQYEMPSSEISETENITAASEPETVPVPEPEEKYESESQEINENDVNDMNNINEENSTGIEDAIRVHNEELAEKVLSQISELPAEMFEVLVTDLLSKMGYRAFQNARYTSDEAGSDLIHGVIIDDKTASAIYIHARKSSPDKTIGRADMQDFIDALSDKGGKGIFATTANFSEQAEVLANDERIMLIDGLKLAGLMIAHNFCVKVEKVYEIKEFDSESFSDYQR
ncbi:MAG: restriction endonuclease [Synergistaceae bacterium]|nr:restriction endonuclease [Synergistaceae bacterium]